MASADVPPLYAPQKLARYRSVQASHPSSHPVSNNASAAASTARNASISRSMSRYRKTAHGVPPPPLPLPAQLDSQRPSYDLAPYDHHHYNEDDDDRQQDVVSGPASRRVSMQNTARPLTGAAAAGAAARRSLDRNSAKRHSSYSQQQYFDGRDSYDRPSRSSGPYFVVEPGMGPNTFDQSYEMTPAAAPTTTTTTTTNNKKSKGRLLKEKGGGLLGRLKGEERLKKKDKMAAVDGYNTASNATSNITRSGAGVDAPVSAVNAGERRVTVTCNEASVSLPVTPSTQAQDLICSAANCLAEDIVPEAAIIVESFAQLNLERPLRRYEHVRDVLNSWNSDSQNTLKIIPDPDPNIIPALLAKSAPRRQPPDVSFSLYHCQRTGKWDRRWVTLRMDGQVTVSKKQGSSDCTNICHISDFDIYTPTRREYKRLKPPKPLCFAIKSQQKSAMFLSTENFVHYFCTKHEDVGGAWHNAVQEWRSWYLVHVMGEGARKKKQQDAPEPVDDNTPYQLGSFQSLSIDPNIEEAYNKLTGKRSRPTSFSHQTGNVAAAAAAAAPLVNQAVNKEPIKPKRTKSKSKKKTTAAAAADDSLSEEQPFAPTGLLGRTYTQRHKAMLDREKEQHAQPDEGPFISTGLLSNMHHHQGPASPVSNHLPDQQYHQHQQQHPHYHPSRSNTTAADPRPTTTSSRSKSTRHPPKPLIDLTPTYKEPPQHARKGRGVTPIQGLPLVESATGPDLHPNAIVVPPSTTWRKPRTSDPNPGPPNPNTSRHRSRQNTAGAAGAPLVDLNAIDPVDQGHGHIHMAMPGSFPFAPTGLVAQSQKLAASQGAARGGRGVATGDKKKGKPLLDMSHVPLPAHYQHPQADSD
ncbi:hypothetical protein H112_00026 [Trichophyton rubrum D6]|uniref:PH domain-containing protein n=3 Tax=Trichophyton rubrum TaxID=5551 RepID=A0A178F828_TRIRU|nr:uncharacterized protein TERG_08579 [Trichophyton rubrum CBS 118892]EZF28045.1 hypothetical protein H100_00024 [Trichophyton rubrum MR850]EZF47105.1 hypothetical protein H102_00024 [Trichophyton rubrum CBS 100081]EZF57758.1 hypothetical protein H103_00025 [Trichophyton rubrum CBS 288.86]EZF68363.1 hypothetical protein H104_00023 [Trichophyton rubrum CBS 289.86]EZF89673.1 hypothetical protein H110_00024 [Trichophyton rubrum MR1448]EZG00488.1 hypothetical protein H113_00026 [Trichophyton rubr